MLSVYLASLKRNPRRWLDILWVILFLIYSIYFIFSVRLSQYPATVAGDYRAFYATAQIALTKGFSQVYNLQLQGQFQAALHKQSPFESFLASVDPVPMPYLPAFVLLFLPLPIMGYVPGFVMWDLVNLIVLFAYLYRFNRSVGNKNGRDALLQLVVCLPVASNMLLGQMNVFLVVCLGEFLLASLDGREELAGLWLGGLLLKPQILIFILPGLLMRRRYRTLAGFAACGAGLLGLSLLLVGPYGLRDLASLILQYVHGLPTNAPEVMMNWRAFAINLGILFPKPLGWVLALGGIVVTAFLTLSLWALPVESRSSQVGLLLLGTFAGTFTVAWHAHNHMEMVLIPLILFLYARKMLPWKMMYLWLFAPPLSLGVMSLVLPRVAYNLFGSVTLAINLLLLVWATRSLRAHSSRLVRQEAGIGSYG